MDDSDPDHNKITVESCEKGVQLIIRTDDKKEKPGKLDIHPTPIHHVIPRAQPYLTLSFGFLDRVYLIWHL